MSQSDAAHVLSVTFDRAIRHAPDAFTRRGIARAFRKARRALRAGDTRPVVLLAARYA